jgi:hypothetical protein
MTKHKRIQLDLRFEVRQPLLAQVYGTFWHEIGNKMLVRVSGILHGDIRQVLSK